MGGSGASTVITCNSSIAGAQPPTPGGPKPNSSGSGRTGLKSISPPRGPVTRPVPNNTASVGRSRLAIIAASGSSAATAPGGAASKVADHAKAAADEIAAEARHAGQTVREQAAAVAGTAKDELARQAAGGKNQIADRISSFADHVQASAADLRRDEAWLADLLDEGGRQLGSLAETLKGKVNTLNYRTIRYPGHAAIMKALLNDLGLRHRRDLLKDILENALPTTTQDVVIIFVTVSGRREGRLIQETYANKIYSRSCTICHQMVHGSNAPSGKALLR